MVGHDLVVEEHHDALGVGPHQDHPAGGACVDAVAIMIGRDQAGGRGAHRLLDKAVERPAQLHQARPFVLEYVPDRPVVSGGLILPSYGV